MIRTLGLSLLLFAVALQAGASHTSPVCTDADESPTACAQLRRTDLTWEVVVDSSGERVATVRSDDAINLALDTIDANWVEGTGDFNADAARQDCRSLAGLTDAVIDEFLP